METIILGAITLLLGVFYYKRGQELYEVEQERDYYLGMRSRVEDKIEELPDNSTISQSRKVLFDLMHTYKKGESQ